MNGQEKILSVSEYISFLNSGLKEYRAKIIGEVSEAKAWPSGHVYFALKDEKDGSVISCVIWKTNYSLYGIELKSGIEIIASGCPNVYAPTGRLSFVVDVIELAGEGALKKEYERLKKQLAAEGLFAPERKRAIPRCPQKIGLITSKSGAVLADFLSNIGKFGFQIKMIDSGVEGQDAVSELLRSIKTFRTKNIEILAIIRGGGSQESLEVFNNEALVREVANFPVPVIVAIGHHKDEPLVDFVADVSVSTPTAVATEISRSWNELLLFLERQEREIFGRYEEILKNYAAIENKLKISLQNFKNVLLNAKMDLDNFLNGVSLKFGALLDKTSKTLEYSEKTVLLNNPARQLELGYSIASVNGKIIRETSDVKIGENIDIRVSNGTINSQVKKII